MSARSDKNVYMSLNRYVTEIRIKQLPRLVDKSYIISLVKSKSRRTCIRWQLDANLTAERQSIQRTTLLSTFKLITNLRIMVVI